MQELSAATDLITSGLREIWTRALDAPPSLNPVWIHGDLHPGNVLAEAGRITGVIDWGDLNRGDPATDLASAWMLFDDATTRQAFFEAYAGLDEAALARSRGWAVFFGVMLLDISLADNPAHAAAGERTLRRLSG